MSDSILSGRWLVYYAAENNRKAIKRDTAVTPTTLDTVRGLYSALQNLFDDPAQMDDVTPMKADTPDIFRMQNQWFIDDESVEYLKSGSLFSDKWKDGTIEHILVIGYAQTTEFNAADIGRTIRGATTGDTGTILDFNTARKLVWIRPDDPLAGGDEFDNGTESYSIGAAADGDVAAQVWQVDATPGPDVFVDETADFNSVGASDVAFFPATEAVNDYCAFGFALKFSKLRLNIGTAGVGGTVAWEYWNGSAWAALTGVTDGTTNLTTGGTNNVTYTVPSDWATTSLNGSAQLFYIRARVTGVYSTNPLGTQGWMSGVGAGAFAAHGRHGTASKAGESAWVGITTIGTIETNDHIDIFQQDPDGFDSASEVREKKVVATKGASDWWGDGQLDILLKVKEADSILGRLPNSSPATAVATVIDRQYTKQYSHFIAKSLATAGGNTVVPLATAVDLNNTTGHRQFTGSSGTGTFQVGEVISKSGTNKKGVVRKVAGTGVAPVLDYYLIGDPQTDFVNGDTAVTGETSGATCTAGTPANVGPALDTAITVTFGATTQDINNGNGARKYSVRIDPASLAILRVYERMKYITRRGSLEALTIGNHTQDGEEYVGDELQIPYTTQAGGEFVQGQRVFDQTAKGIGVVVADHVAGTAGDLILRVLRGTFTNGNVVSDTPAATLTLAAALSMVGSNPDSGTTVDETADAISAAGADVLPYPAVEAVNDSFYIGAAEVFGLLSIDIATSGAGGTPAVAWEYWNGSAWVALPGLSDGTSAFTAAAGFQNVTWDVPSNWVARTVGAGTSGTQIRGPLYYVRARLTSVYTTTNPVLDEVQVQDKVTATIGTQRTITPVAASPFGTFAGGKFFGAPGVTLTTANLLGADVQAYQLIDDLGVTQIPPNSVGVSVTNLISGDTVAVFRRSGTAILKAEFTLAAGNNISGTTVVVNQAIPASVPTTSKVRIVSPSGAEHRYRSSSFATSTFTLATGVVNGASGGANSSATRLHDTVGSPFTSAEVGDYVRNRTEGKVVRITNVVNANEVDTEAVTNWSGDNYDYNVLMETYPSGQNTYVPIIERVASATSHSATITHSVDIDVKAVVRRSGLATKILPFEQDTTVVSTGLSVSAIRTADEIIT